MRTAIEIFREHCGEHIKHTNRIVFAMELYAEQFKPKSKPKAVLGDVDTCAHQYQKVKGERLKWTCTLCHSTIESN